MRVLLFLSLLLLVTACNTAGPHFRGLPAVQVSIAGSDFDVRVRGELAEAIRTNREYAPRLGVMAERAKRAMAEVSGCKVKEIRGDQAQMLGLLDCGKGKSARTAIPPGRTLDCYEVSRYEISSIGQEIREYDCDWE